MQRKRFAHRSPAQNAHPAPIPPPLEDEDDDTLDPDLDETVDPEDEASESESAELWRRWLIANQR